MSLTLSNQTTDNSHTAAAHIFRLATVVELSGDAAFTHHSWDNGLVKEENKFVDSEQSKRLGAYLRARRELLKLTTRQLAERAGLTDSTIVRIEQGAFAAPSPDKLAKLAESLGLSLADVYALADYAVPADLPNVGPYLRTKFRNLPSGTVEELQSQISQILRQHGIEPNEGPEHGEDEVADT